MSRRSQLGSLWRKWDLHFHTPSSFDYRDKSVTDHQIVNGLIEASIEVVAITDHHLIDCERIESLRQLSGSELTIFPGVEFRSNLGSKPIHFIALFSETVDVRLLWTKLQGQLNMTRRDIDARGGDEKVWFDLARTSEIVHELGGIISIHAGVKSNSIEDISNREQFQQRLKLDIANDYVDILEVGQLKDITSYMDTVFPNTGLGHPLIVGSDNHSINVYETHAPCWIKADPTFLGLRQVLNEPRDRVFVGNEPPGIERRRTTPHKFIRRLSIEKKAESRLSEVWFDDVDLRLNSGLVAIIGNKGSGKSALTDILGLLGNSRNADSFSFLSESKFRHPKSNKASHFTATLWWGDGDHVQLRLSDEPAGTSERVKYIPQQHLERICDELAMESKGGRTQFDQELEGVIFSRIPESDSLGCSSLEKLVRLKTEALENSVSLLREELSRSVTKLVDLERRSAPAYRGEIEAAVSELEREVTVASSQEPKAIIKPESDPVTRERNEVLSSKVEELGTKIGAIDEKIKKKKEAQLRVNKEIATVDRLRGELSNLEEYIKSFGRRIASDCESLDISPETLYEVKLNRQPLDSRRSELVAERTALMDSLAVEKEGSLPDARDSLKTQLLKVRGQLDRPNQIYQEHLQALATWRTRVRELLGDSTESGSLTFLKRRLASLRALPQELGQAREDLLGCALKIFRKKLELVEEYRLLYAPVQDFVANHPLAGREFGLEFDVAVRQSGFAKRFLDLIHHGRVGSFYGEDDARKLIDELLARADFDTEEGVRSFLEELLDALRFKDGNPEFPELLIKDQIKASVSADDFYDFVFGLEYLKPHYELTWEGKPLGLLSPGERGMLLLVFFLLVDKGDFPLIIDQPEENLDNQSIYELLVHCVKEAKLRRQVILVTHNPNLAVVCDADQIIAASLDKEGACRVEYITGALENPVIGRRIVDILEGTKPAIENRIAKYRVIFDNFASSIVSAGLLAAAHVERGGT